MKIAPHFLGLFYPNSDEWPKSSSNALQYISDTTSWRGASLIYLLSQNIRRRGNLLTIKSAGEENCFRGQCRKCLSLSN